MKKQANGMYRTKVTIGHDETGKPIHKWIQAPTQKKLEEEKRKIREYYIEGIVTAKDQLFAVYCIDWYKARKLPTIAPGTAKGYRSVLNNHILPAFGDRNLRAIRPLELQAFVNRFAGKGSTQIKVVLSILKGVFGSAVQDQIIVRNPAVGLVAPEAAEAEPKRAFTPEERAIIERLCVEHERGLMIAMLYYTGMRNGEARGLKWGDVDWVKGRLHVVRDIDDVLHEEGDLKTPGSERWIPIAPPLMEMLKAARGMPRAYIIPGRDGSAMSYNTARERWIPMRDAAGLPSDLTLHSFRHNYITMCRDAGIRPDDAMRLAGHVSYHTTLRHYTHETEAHMVSVGEQVADMFADKKSCIKVAQDDLGE